MAATPSRRPRGHGRVCEMKVRPERRGARANRRRRLLVKAAPAPPPYPPPLAQEGRVAAQQPGMMAKLRPKARPERQGSPMVQQPPPPYPPLQAGEGREGAAVGPKRRPAVVRLRGTAATPRSRELFWACRVR